MNDLSRMGFNDWFQKRLDQALHSIHQLARVVSVHKDSYVITRGTQEVFAELTGNLLYSADSPLDLPTTGDWVYADFYDNDSHAIIHAVLPRKTLLKRKTSGRKVDFQLVAANIDVAFIIQSLNENFNLNRLERYLVMVNEAGIQPVVLLSKCDLMDADQIARARDQILAVYPGMNLLEFSNLNAFNIDTIRVSLQSGLTYCLLGSSGVGKTTLLNSILGKDEFETRTVSQIQSKGRHTTTTRQLVQLESGAMILDTPGMRELGSLSIEEGLDETFAEIPDIASRCKFTNCSHSNEKGCAIRTAIEAGELSEQRYQNYLKMRRESEFNQMSYLEKRNRDRQFGKMVKNIMQHKKK